MADKNGTVRLAVDADRITIDDLIAIESEDQSAKFLRDFLSRFLIDEDENYLEEEEAKKIIGAMTIKEILTNVNRFKDEIEKMKDRILPPERGGE